MLATDTTLRPRLRVVGDRSRVLQGTAYGLGQPLVLAHVQASDPQRIDLAALDRVIGELIGEPPPARGEAQTDAVHGLLQRVHHWHAAVQRQQNIPVFGGCHIERVATDPSNAADFHFQLAVPCAKPRATSLALQWVIDSVNACACAGQDAQPALAGALEALRQALQPVALKSTNPIHFLGAAHRLGMQVTPLGKDIFCVGLGRASRWLHSSITDATPSIGVLLAKDKRETARVLGRCGIPMPRHELAKDEEHAAEIAQKISYPVVIKPIDQDQGRGVFAGLRSEAALRKAFRAARTFSEHVLVEAHCHGDDYRFTVHGDRVIKIMRRRPGGVWGDGTRTVAELLAQVQASAEHQRALRRQGKLRLELDEEATELLAEQALDAGSVPEAGRFVTLRRKSNVSSGGSHATVPLEQVHPDNRALAVRAARLLRLDLAGVDLILPDAAQPWHECGGAVLEVNAQPQIGIRDTPDIYADILRELVGGDGHLPCHLLVMDRAGALEQAAWCMQLAGELGCNGLASAAGAWLDGVQCVWRPASSFAAARGLLTDTRLGAALIVMSPEDIVRFGLPVNRFDTARLAPGGSGTQAARAPQLEQALRMLAPHARRVLDWPAAERAT